jgi:O-antigen/teichoic acid export membrane protein
MFIHGANTFNVLADRLVIGVMADAEAVGVYHVASQLAMVIVVLRSLLQNRRSQ